MQSFRERIGRRLEPWLVLPASFYLWAILAAGASVTLIRASAWAAAPKYVGLARNDSVRSICEPAPGQRALRLPGIGCKRLRGKSLEQIRASFESTAVEGCAEQLANRALQACEVNAELRLSCSRRTSLYAELRRTGASTRATLREEEGEIVQNYELLRELIGPEQNAGAWGEGLLMFVTAVMALGAILVVGRHSRTVGVKRMLASPHGRRIKRLPGACKAFLSSAAVTLGFALIVVCIESFDRQKTSFAWSSYCTSGPLTLGTWSTRRLPGAAFWLEHASLLTFSALVGVQVVTGWHVTRRGFIPRPNAYAPRWGIERYMTFLEVWCFIIVVMVGFITAVWTRGLLASRTNVESFFIGFGALPFAAWIVVRGVKNAHFLRKRCESLRRAAMKPEKLPPVPSDGLLTANWWQVPTLFVSAYGVCSALLAWAGLGRLLAIGH